MRHLKWIWAPIAVALVGLARGARGDSRADFGPNVQIFDPSMTTIQERVNQAYEKQRKEFCAGRCALLFKPGRYAVDVNVGFYTEVAGLGESPDDVSITGVAQSKASLPNGNATTNFWRAAENFAVTPTGPRRLDIWAVSQGADFRRMHVRGNLNLWDGGWSSGGFLADSKIDGNIASGSQQQWISRNAQWGNWLGGAWNMVFVGVTDPPSGTWPDHPYTVIEKTPIIREKPYLYIDRAGRYWVKVPALREDSQDITWSGGPTAGKSLPIDRFYLARSDRDTAASMNAALESGKNLILTPGIYRLEESLHVTHPDTVILGLGFPTLRPERGTSALAIDDVDGVEVGGVLFEAGTKDSPELVEVGQPGRSASHASDPIFLFDVFCRAGGALAGSADCFVTINSSNVVGDNFWLWRADHGAGANWDTNRNRNGLIVNGRDVTIYGLAVEHCQAYQTLWNGEGGRVYFYQSEMPYDPPSQAAWSHDGVKGFASYKVASGVKTHEAWGLGIYCVFTHAPVVSRSAIEAPDAPGVRFHHMVTLRFGGVKGSGIEHVLNDRGSAVIENSQARLQ
jgi:hypothetical protein